MDVSLSNLLKDTLLTCSQCKSRYNADDKTPMNLPCRHTVCKECLKSHETIRCECCQMEYKICPDTDETYPMNPQLMALLSMMSSIPEMSICSEHNRVIELFCEDHRVPICVLCSAIGHNNCSRNFLQQSYESEVKAIRVLMSDVEKQHIEHEKIQQVINESIDVCENRQQDEYHRAKKHFQKILEMVTKREGEVLSEISSLMNEFKKKLLIKLACNDKSRRISDAALKFTEAAISKSKPVEFLGEVDNLRRHLEHVAVTAIPVETGQQCTVEFAYPKLENIEAIFKKMGQNKSSQVSVNLPDFNFEILRTDAPQMTVSITEGTGDFQIYLVHGSRDVLLQCPVVETTKILQLDDFGKWSSLDSSIEITEDIPIMAMGVSGMAVAIGSRPFPRSGKIFFKLAVTGELSGTDELDFIIGRKPKILMNSLYSCTSGNGLQLSMSRTKPVLYIYERIRGEWGARYNFSHGVRQGNAIDIELGFILDADNMTLTVLDSGKIIFIISRIEMEEQLWPWVSSSKSIRTSFIPARNHTGLSNAEVKSILMSRSK